MQAQIQSLHKEYTASHSLSYTLLMLSMDVRLFGDVTHYSVRVLTTSAYAKLVDKYYAPTV